MLNEINIEGRKIGPEHPVFIIAEVGYNFNTMEEAKQSIDSAIECGADAIKFQTFQAETVAAKNVDFPEEAGSSNQFEEFKNYELSREQHIELFNYSNEKGILPFSTPSYFDDVDLLEELNVPLYKIGSDDLTNLPFLKYIARTGKPIIFSTGMATFEEVAEAVAAIRGEGNEQIVVLQCTSNYPVKDLQLVNLNVIPTYRQAFGVLSGFSDHTETISCGAASIALGACVVEKHFTLSKELDAPDAFLSADPSEMKALVDAIREVELALGSSVKKPASTEQEMRSDTRKSLMARSFILKGEKITKENTIVKRPGSGIAPKLSHLAYGRLAVQDIKEDESITWDKVGSS